MGNGASVSAVKDGKCIDTSMGLTPLEGLVMGTRSGDIDPAVIEYLMDKTGMDIHEATNYLNKKSGVDGAVTPARAWRSACSHTESKNISALMPQLWAAWTAWCSPAE